MLYRLGQAIRGLALAALVASCVATPCVAGNGLHLSGNKYWAVIASRKTTNEAIGLARFYQNLKSNVRVIQSQNGWFAVAFGPVQVSGDLQTAKIALNRDHQLPDDFYLSRGARYVSTIWQGDPSHILGTASLSSGQPRNTASVGLTISLSTKPASDNELIPVATGFYFGREIFQMAIHRAQSASPIADAKIVKLADAPIPQVIFSAFTGGAHCCTITKIATVREGTWRIVDAGILDGEGYGIEDIDGDGVDELISVDNSFLYAFAPYASSFAPSKVFRLKATHLADVTRDPRYQSYLSQDAYRIEYIGSKYSESRDNGFLAGWVAAKTLIGQLDAAWAVMLTSYNRSSDWPLWECADRQLPAASCPKSQQRNVSFPFALRRHLLVHGYISPQVALRLPTDSFSGVAQAPGSTATAVPLVVQRRPEPVVPGDHVTSSGTGFFVNRDGAVLTNAHVVDGCRRLTVTTAENRSYAATVTSKDRTNDLALLRIGANSTSPATFKNTVRLGEAVAAFGFPLSGLLSSSGNFTLGNVTALAGIGDDTRDVQISAPVQPGNSGGPLLDQTGSVVGIVTSKLNALKLAAATKDIPENVNFAIKSMVATNFLDATSTKYESGTSNTPLSPVDLADRAKSVSVHIKCFE